CPACRAASGAGRRTHSISTGRSAAAYRPLGQWVLFATGRCRAQPPFCGDTCVGCCRCGGGGFGPGPVGRSGIATDGGGAGVFPVVAEGAAPPPRHGAPDSRVSGPRG